MTFTGSTAAAVTTGSEAMSDTTSRSPKSDFIRAQPLDMTGPDVVKAAKKAGLALSDKLVYGVRAEMKKASELTVRPRKPGRAQMSYDLWEAAQRAKREAADAPVAAAALVALAAAVPEVVREYRRLVMRLGTARARALLDSFEREAEFSRARRRARGVT